ncbi:MAG: DUF1440 domain-containing protein [Chloroflexota bacterium]|nr:DUF1440 domain-containing protein [Chloroflexota bacterium]
MNQHEPNRWKGFILGAIGGAVGVIAMRYYWKIASAIAGGDPRNQSGDPKPHALDSISLIGQHHQEGESSTAALGRIAYQTIKGQAPESQETRTTLSYLVHWLLSMFMGGVYGALRGPADAPDVQGGLALGIGLWLFGDELAFPMMGLTKGPTAYPFAVHAHGFGAHLPYGLVTAGTTQLLQRLV